MARPPLPLAAARLYGRLVAPLWAIAALVSLPAVPVVYWRGTAPSSALAALAVAAVGLAGSWLGCAWCRALTVQLAAGRPPALGAAWRAVRLGRPGFWAAGAVRALMVYAPLALLQLVAVAQPAATEVGRPNFVPLAVLLLVPLAANLAVLYALAPCRAACEPGLGVRATLERGRAAADRSLFGLFLQAGVLAVFCQLLSILPTERLLYFPNHFVGTFLWVTLAVLDERAAALPEGSDLDRPPVVP